MSDEGFLRAICEDPHDLGIREIYADWLDDHGETERAEFIRVQCELARWKRYQAPPEILEIANSGRLYAQSAIDLISEKAHEHNVREEALRRRERELLDRYAPLWLLRFYEDVCGNASFKGAEFRQGFIESVECTCAGWLAHGPGIVREQPVTEVKLTNLDTPDYLVGIEEWSEVIRNPVAWARRAAGLPPIQ